MQSHESDRPVVAASDPLWTLTIFLCAGGFKPVLSIENNAEVKTAADFATKEVCAQVCASSNALP